jgi:AbrB family looped-hinge helix DNA binding protein
MARKSSGNLGNITDFTSISSKGQIVIPKSMRSALGLKEGDLFAASVVNENMIVLKKLSPSMTEDDKRTLKKIAASWREIYSGKSKRMSSEEFLKQLHEW